MNAQQLRSRLLNLLKEELGKYKNGHPSIWIYGSSSNPPSVSDGLECLIKESPSNAAVGSSGGQKYKDQRWEITLKNYKPSANLTQAIRKIELRFRVQYTHTPATSDVFEQARISIFDPIGVNL